MKYTGYSNGYYWFLLNFSLFSFYRIRTGPEDTSNDLNLIIHEVSRITCSHLNSKVLDLILKEMKIDTTEDSTEIKLKMIVMFLDFESFKKKQFIFGHDKYPPAISNLTILLENLFETEIIDHLYFAIYEIFSILADLSECIPEPIKIVPEDNVVATHYIAKVIHKKITSILNLYPLIEKDSEINEAIKWLYRFVIVSHNLYSVTKRNNTFLAGYKNARKIYENKQLRFNNLVNILEYDVFIAEVSSQNELINFLVKRDFEFCKENNFSVYKNSFEELEKKYTGKKSKINLARSKSGIWITESLKGMVAVNIKNPDSKRKLIEILQIEENFLQIFKNINNVHDI